MQPILYIVSPCYNSSDVLQESVPAFIKKLNTLKEQNKISEQSKLLLVDDGSHDSTWDCICNFCKIYTDIISVKLSHNSGEQNAYLAGMTVASDSADVIVTIDCDLQDDIEKIDEMLVHYNNGCEIVYGVRCNRSTDTPLYRFLSGGFYKIMKLLKTELVEQNSQFRLMSSKAVKLLLQYSESDVFLPALVPLVGLKNAKVEYKRLERAAGKSGYSFGRLFKLAFTAITSFSAAPLSIISIFAVFCLLSFSAFITVFFIRLSSTGYFSPEVFGWLIGACCWLIGFFILAASRLLGYYICAVFRQTKRRPRFQIEIINKNDK